MRRAAVASFPVARYRTERGVHHRDLIDDRRGTYLLKGEDQRQSASPQLWSP